MNSARRAARGRDYHLRGIAYPMLVCEAEDKPFLPGQPRQPYDMPTCAKAFLRFIAEAGVGEHCHVVAHTLFHQRAFDWLGGVLC